MACWFISDLHLSAERPAVTQAFLHWLQTTVVDAEALYILGDFFEVWVGDDALTLPEYQQPYAPVVQALRALSQAGVQLFFMHGNRDFLLGEAFAEMTGLHYLADPTPLAYAQQRILLSHGDALCTDDLAYQQFRSQVRDPQWQQRFLSQPLSDRIDFSKQARGQSQKNKAMQSMDIMDVNTVAVEALMREYGYPDVLLHGHTHRPAMHMLTVDGHSCKRMVLGDWHETAVVAKLDERGLHMQTLHLNSA